MRREVLQGSAAQTKRTRARWGVQSIDRCEWRTGTLRHKPPEPEMAVAIVEGDEQAQEDAVEERATSTQCCVRPAGHEGDAKDDDRVCGQHCHELGQCVIPFVPPAPLP